MPCHSDMISSSLMTSSLALGDLSRGDAKFSEAVTANTRVNGEDGGVTVVNGEDLGVVHAGLSDQRNGGVGCCVEDTEKRSP